MEGCIVGIRNGHSVALLLRYSLRSLLSPTLTPHLMDPLNSEHKLQQKGTQQEREQVLRGSDGHHRHDPAEGIAQEETKHLQELN